MSTRQRVNRLARAGGLLAGLTLVLMSPTPTVAQQADGVAEGSRVYGNTCGNCHNARSPLERTDREWVTIINHMRVRANLTGGETRSVLAFLQATNGDPGEGAPPAVGAVSEAISDDPGVVARGQQLSVEKACIGCHIIGGVGGAVGPSLRRVIERRGAAYVRQKMADPAFDNTTSMMPNFGLTSEEIDALVAYLATLASDEDGAS